MLRNWMAWWCVKGWREKVGNRHGTKTWANFSPPAKRGQHVVEMEASEVGWTLTTCVVWFSLSAQRVLTWSWNTCYYKRDKQKIRKICNVTSISWIAWWGKWYIPVYLYSYLLKWQMKDYFISLLFHIVWVVQTPTPLKIKNTGVSEIQG